MKDLGLKGKWIIAWLRKWGMDTGVLLWSTGLRALELGVWGQLEVECVLFFLTSASRAP